VLGWGNCAVVAGGGILGVQRESPEQLRGIALAAAAAEAACGLQSCLRFSA